MIIYDLAIYSSVAIDMNWILIDILYRQKVSYHILICDFYLAFMID